MGVIEGFTDSVVEGLIEGFDVVLNICQRK